MQSNVLITFYNARSEHSFLITLYAFEDEVWPKLIYKWFILNKIVIATSMI